MRARGEQQVFMVDWVLPTVSVDDLHAAQQALEEATRRLSADGEPIECLRSTYVPSQRRWLCLFAAGNADAVRKSHEIAQIPVHHVDEVIDLPVGRHAIC
jgi:hypothetical protein